MGKKVLLLGVYGMEMVECGGALYKNVLDGGNSYASIMIASETMRSDVREAAKVLGTEVEFLPYKQGEIMPTPEQKLPMIRLIRRIRPDVIITQDTEHCMHDLDPDRRMAMMVILESIALAGRNYELNGDEPCPIPPIYYMTPDRPNCILNIADVWREKVQAMDCLKAQMVFSGQHYQKYFGDDIMKQVVPNWADLSSDYEKGKLAITEFNKSYYLNNGSLNHGHYSFAETYRKEGLFHMEQITD